uniref:Uncharacterized protein n=1 Tax=Triticum urartu TaxID=4572 RepID=A0A8R7QKA6_TRIUA
MAPGRYPSSLGGASCRSRPALWSRPSLPPPRRRRRGSRLHQARAPPHPTDRKGIDHCKYSRRFKCSSSGRLKFNKDADKVIEVMKLRVVYTLPSGRDT